MLGLIVSLLLAEVIYRLYCYSVENNINALVRGNRPPVKKPAMELKLGQIIQFAKFRKEVYELIPNSSYRFMGVPVQTNSKGFRDTETSEQKPKRTRRIIGIGDSIMFGWGVGQEENYLALLEQMLNNLDSFQYEVINTAVPGYNTTMEVETLERKFDLSQVNHVILNFVGNDLDLPNFIRKKPNYWTLEKSFILMRFEPKDGWNGNDNRLRDAPYDNKRKAYMQDLKQIPEEYSDMVGEDAFHRAMGRLHALSVQYGFGVTVLSTDQHEPAPDYVHKACSVNGFSLLEINSSWDRYRQANPNATWKLKDKDYHPNTTGHQIIADAMLDFFKSNPITE